LLQFNKLFFNIKVLFLVESPYLFKSDAIYQKKKLFREHHENVLANQKLACPQIMGVMAEI